jgi:hypothetical protein
MNMPGGARHVATLAAVAMWLVVLATMPAAEQSGKNAKAGDARPKFSMRAQPSVGIAPTRVLFNAEMVGGADDFEEYYCASVEWDWGDDTTSESNTDCEPYEAGKSTIRRRFSNTHTFQRSGSYKVSIRLKRGDRQVATASVNIQIRPGIREF